MKKLKILISVVLALTIVLFDISLDFNSPAINGSLNKHLIKVGPQKAYGESNLCFYEKWLYKELFEMKEVGSTGISNNPSGYLSYIFNRETGKFTPAGGYLNRVADWTVYTCSGSYLHAARINSRFPEDCVDISYTSKSLGYKKVVLVDTIEAADGTYPDNGLHTDGYWYVKHPSNTKLYYYDRYSSKKYFSYREDKYTNVDDSYMSFSGYSSYNFDKYTGFFSNAGSYLSEVRYKSCYSSDKTILYDKYAYNRSYSTTVYYSYAAGYEKDTLLSTFKAPEGIYPNNGYYTDGYYYIKVELPSLVVSSPSANGIYNSPFIPSVTVSDKDGDILTCKYYLDSESMPRETKQISNTATAQNISFNMLDIGTLSGVSHSITFEVSDGKAPPAKQTVAFNIDKVPPEINPIGCTATDTSITVTGSAKSTVTDLNDLPYRYTVNGAESTWRTDKTYTAGSLTPNTKYTVKFEARDKLGNTASDQKDVYTKAQKPAISATGSTETTLDLKITDSNPAGTQYQITAGTQYVNSSGSLTESPQWFAPANKSITIKGLQQNTGYTVGAKAKNAEGAETDTSQASRTTLAAPPAITFKEVNQTSINLGWSAIPGATYILEADGVSKGSVTGTEYTHINLSPETEHKYRIKAVNGGGEGNWSSYYNATTLPFRPTAPTTVSAIETQTTVTLSWDKIAKATSYEIEIDGSTTPLSVGNALTYIHSGLTPEKEHKYRVRAVNAGGASDWSPYIAVTTLPVPPPVPEGIEVSKTNTSITLKWKALDRATSYLVEADGQVIDNKAETTYTHKELTSLSRHIYRVKALNRGGDNGWSKELIVITNPDKPETPSNIIATADISTISLTWYEVPYADRYDIEIDGSTIVNTTGTAASYEHKGLQPDSPHTYRIKAVNVTGESEWGKLITISTLPEPTSGDDGEPTDASLTNVIAIVTNKTITLSWDAVTHDGAYEIEVDGKLSDNGKNTSFSHTSLTAETYHTYKIRVKDSEGKGEWCAVLTLSTMPDIPDAPKGLKALAADNSIEIRWDKVTGAMGYDVEADGTVVDAGELESYIQNPLEPGTTHTYRVRAKNISGVTAWSEVISPSTTNPTYTLECKKGEEFSLSLVASDVRDFTGLRFVVTYDVNELGIADMCGFTPKKDVISEGSIPGTRLKVKSEAGRMEFTLDESVTPGTVWSGEVTDIVFVPNVSGEIKLNFYIVTY